MRVKELTGGDTLSARFMRAEWFDFKPVAKLWLATNHKPQVRGTDEAIWRRIRLIPFTVTIPEAERDKEIGEKLRAELAGHPRLGRARLPRLAARWASARRPRCGPRPRPIGPSRTCSARSSTTAAPWPRAAGSPRPRCSARTVSGARPQARQPMTQRALGLVLRERGFDDSREGKERTRGWLGIGLQSRIGGQKGGRDRMRPQVPYLTYARAHERCNREVASACGHVSASGGGAEAPLRVRAFALLGRHGAGSKASRGRGSPPIQHSAPLLAADEHGVCRSEPTAGGSASAPG